METKICRRCLKEKPLDCFSRRGEGSVKKRINCETGKLLFFSSDIWHKAEMSTGEKKVLVGAVDSNVV